jgi:hypothetical protein
MRRATALAGVQRGSRGGRTLIGAVPAPFRESASQVKIDQFAKNRVEDDLYLRRPLDRFPKEKIPLPILSMFE